MLSHYVEICWMLIGIYILSKPHLSPWIGYVVGAMLLVLSIVKIFG